LVLVVRRAAEAGRHTTEKAPHQRGRSRHS
jgi:hypothetical protein